MMAQDGCRSTGFTLIEILIVVVILGILAAAVIPEFSDAADDARINATAAIRASTQRLVTAERARTGDWPAAIDGSMFEGLSLPEHPGNSFGVPAFQVVTAAGTSHPTNKVLKGGVAGAFWYNTADGIVRARMPDMGSAESTMDAYNRVNNSSETDLGNYGSGGGGS